MCLTSVLSDPGSEKKEMFRTLRSCPALEGITPPDADSYSSLILPRSKHLQATAPARKFGLPHTRVGLLLPWKRASLMSINPSFSTEEEGMECVVCMEGLATSTLGCGHRCLCHGCTDRIVMEFNRCPLCRQKISSVEVR